MLLLASRTPFKNSHAQYTLQLGKTNNQVEVLNFLKADSGLILPNIKIISPYYGPSGQIAYQKSDSTPYFHNGATWIKILSTLSGWTRSQVDSAILSKGYITAASIAGKVNYSDSNTTFVTPKVFRDSVKSVRLSIPTNNNQIANGASYITASAISGKVNYSDSGITFVTPKNIKDTAAAIRLAIPTNNNQLTNGSGYITSSAISGKVNYSDSLTTFATPKNIKDSTSSLRLSIPTNNNQLSNGSGYITGITSGNITTALGYTPVTNARTITVAGTTFDLSANRTFSPTTSDIPEGANLYYTDARARAAISLTTTGSGAATYTSGVLNIPTFSTYVPAIHSVTRPINSATFTPSLTLQASLTYTIQITCTATIGSASTGQILFQYSTNGGSSWTDGGTLKNSNTVTLAVALMLVNTQIASINVIVPAGALCRLVPTTSGTTSITYISGFEVY